MRKRAYSLFVIFSIALFLVVIGFGASGREQKERERNSVCRLEYSHLVGNEAKESQGKNENDEDINRLRRIRRASCNWWPIQEKMPSCLFCCMEKIIRQNPTIPRPKLPG